jgi:xanthine dehydrogenase large subunit
VLSPVAHGRLKKVEVPIVARRRRRARAQRHSRQERRRAVGSDEPLFASDRVFHAGQPLCMVVATTLDAARHAAEHAVIEIDPEPAILDIESALAAKAYVQAPQTLLRGDPDAALEAAPHRLSAEFRVGGQEHFYLEGQVAFACRARTATSSCIPRPSIRPRSSTSAPVCWAATSTG